MFSFCVKGRRAAANVHTKEHLIYCQMTLILRSIGSLSVKSGRFLSRNMSVRSTAASGSQVYESKRAVDEYLLFHYGKDEDLMPFTTVGANFALHFSQRSVNIANEIVRTHNGSFGRALDIGCAVGGLSFELSKHFSEVVGIDFSHHFVDAANELKSKGHKSYNILKSGQIFYSAEAVIPADVQREKVHFSQGDACNLNPSIG